MSFELGDFVADGTGRIGKVVKVHGPSPVLYAFELATCKWGYAYEEELHPATAPQIAEFADARTEYVGRALSHRLSDLPHVPPPKVTDGR